MNIIKYLLCKNSGMSNGESFLRASTNMPISGGAAKVIEKTVPFADIISITDALARPAVDLQTEITATQNLNGYEYPWVGGAGKNKLDVELPITLSGEGNIGNKPCVLPSGTYTYTSKTSTSQAYVLTVHNGNGTEIARIFSASASADFLSVTFTTTEESAYIRCYYNGATTITHMQIESGSAFTGYAPYENICPISGRTEVNVTRTGNNLLIPRSRPETVVNGITYTANEDGSISISGTATADADWIISTAGTNPIIVPNGTYTFSADGLVSGVKFIVSGGARNRFPYREMTVNSTSGTGTISDSSKPFEYIILRVLNGTNVNTVVHPQLELGSTATEYEPYNGNTYPTSLGRTVYGGTLDLTTGELTLTHAYVDLGDLTWTKFNNVFEATINDKKNGATNFITTSYRTVEKAFTVLENGETTSTNRFPVPSIFIKDERVITPQDFKTLVTEQKMVYELATPQTISLTPTEVMMLENNNTIWADSGRVQLTYYAPKED